MLTAYDGAAISYDGVGNPTNDGTWAYTWTQGRQLSRMKQLSNSSNDWYFTYNADGMRTKRVCGSDVYTYVYNSGQLAQMTYNGIVLDFTYDANGRPVAVRYNGVTYYYVLNLQGDVIAILNSSGTAVVQYTYDTWGKLLTTTGSMSPNLGVHNPLRYRGYVYDRELGLYYLQSRYYNPTWSRFINADALVSTDQGIIGNNMFAYCNNNPISFADPYGNSCRLVGAGIQFEIDVGGATFGVEIIVYWDVAECCNGGLTVAVYAYGGVSMPVTDPFLASIVATMTDNAALLSIGSEKGVLAVAAMIGEGFSINASGVMVFGYDNFTTTESYTESFTSIGGGLGRFKGSYAYSESCFAVSLGYDIVGLDIVSTPNISKTYYWQVYEFTIGANLSGKQPRKNRSSSIGGGGGTLCRVSCLY